MDTQFANVTSTRAFLTFYYKNRRRLLLAFWLPFLLAIAISFVPAPRYKASTVLTVRMGSEYVYQPEVGTAQNVPQATIPFDRDQIFKAEVAILSSDDLHRDVIQKIGVDTLYPGLSREYADKPDPAAYTMSKAISKFDKRFDVGLERESSVITVTFEDKDAAMANRVLDILLPLYMEKRKMLYMEPRVEMARAREEDARQHVLAAEKALEIFKRDHNILSFDSERQSLILQRSEIQQQAASVKSAGLNEKLDYFEQKLKKLNEDEAQFNALSHDVSVANDEYAVFAHRLSEAAAYEDMEHERVGSVRVIQPPSTPAEPLDLQPFIIIGGFALSCLSALALALILDMLGSGFLTPEQLQREIKLPVLVALPHVKS